jgi:hypothetical protein
MKRAKQNNSRHLPASLRSLFWEYDFKILTWKQDQDLVISRIISVGDWEAITWLRQQLGDDRLADWIKQRAGAGLSRRQIRFWELILLLPRRQVNAWLAAKDRITWDRRLKR